LVKEGSENRIFVRGGLRVGEGGDKRERDRGVVLSNGHEDEAGRKEKVVVSVYLIQRSVNIMRF
jgi:hypothetical protein